MVNIRPIEIFLLQFVLYFILWLVDDYLATLLSISFGVIAFFVLVIALISEWIEKSKVPRIYFSFMVISMITPFLVGAIYLLLKKGQLSWLEGGGLF
ncbi:MAG: hypothetical protein AB8G15_08190 [Saprospiraceae bacterium]